MPPFFNYLSAQRMQSPDLLQLAALVALHGQELAENAATISDTSLQRYWTSAKCRLDRWGRHLRSVAREDVCSQQTPRLVPLMEEIVTSEVLTRVWTAVVHAAADDKGRENSLSVVDSIKSGHCEARHRALGLVATDKVRRRDANHIARLHRRVSRWTDLLIAHLQQTHEVSQFAMDQKRCLDFADDLHYQNDRPGSENTGPLTIASMRTAICRRLYPQSPNADLNYQIGASVVACCETDSWQGSDLFDSLWAIRLLNNASHCETLVDFFLATI